MSSTFGGPAQPGLGEDTEGDDDDDDDDEGNDDGGSSSSSDGGVVTTGLDPTTTSGTTMTVLETSDGDSTTGVADESSTGPGDVGPQPGSGMWAHCLDATDCIAPFGCLTDDTMTDGFCTMLCEPAGNPAACGAGPLGTTVTCTTASGGESICALDCMSGQPCPTGMVCADGICM